MSFLVFGMYVVGELLGSVPSVQFRFLLASIVDKDGAGDNDGVGDGDGIRDEDWDGPGGDSREDRIEDEDEVGDGDAVRDKDGIVVFRFRKVLEWRERRYF